MARLFPLRLLIVLSAICLLSRPALSSDSTLANKLPSGAIVFAEVRGLDKVITSVRESERLQMVL